MHPMDFAMRPVNSILCLPNRKVKFFLKNFSGISNYRSALHKKKSLYKFNSKFINHPSKKLLGASENDFRVSAPQLQLAHGASLKIGFLHSTSSIYSIRPVAELCAYTFLALSFIVFLFPPSTGFPFKEGITEDLIS